MMYGWGNQGWGVGVWIVMAVAMVIFWAIVVFGVVGLVRYLGHSHDTPSAPASGPTSDAETVLRDRLARGEIDEEQFRKTLGALREP
ncbi:MAG: SHOCT domain-containing protein [Acidimicrobiales bacterium]